MIKSIANKQINYFEEFLFKIKVRKRPQPAGTYKVRTNRQEPRLSGNKHETINLIFKTLIVLRCTAAAMQVQGRTFNPL